MRGPDNMIAIRLEHCATFYELLDKRKDIMGVTFNGNVTINGNVEMYDNGSMKITYGGVLNIPITEMRGFIEENLKYSPNKEDYLTAGEDLENTEDRTKIQKAIEKIKDMAIEIGRNVLIQGLSQEVGKVINSL